LQSRRRRYSGPEAGSRNACAIPGLLGAQDFSASTIDCSLLFASRVVEGELLPAHFDKTTGNRQTRRCNPNNGNKPWRARRPKDAPFEAE
jgi:hypothetical protein